MTSADEGDTPSRDEQTRLAISLAMQGKWQEAVSVNQALLEEYPEDVEACNRLGRALMELGEYSAARDAYGRTLDASPHNKIARKNMERLLRLVEEPQASRAEQHKLSADIFVRESGKAGVVGVEELASASVLARVTAGEEVVLAIADGTLLVQNKKGAYLGRVETKYERRLIRLMEGGNKYTAAISSLRDDEMKLVVKETYQDPSQVGHHSFEPEEIKGFRPTARRSLFRYDLEDDAVELNGDDVEEDREQGMADLGFHEVSSGG
jgi:hypothetical protein